MSISEKKLYQITCDFFDKNSDGAYTQCKNSINVTSTAEYLVKLPEGWTSKFDPCERGCCGNTKHYCSKHPSKPT